jgi:hypothetical protein
MADVYVYSGAAGTASGADWTNAKLTLAAAFVIAVAGDNIWVANDHAESTSGGGALTSVGTSTSPIKVYCVNRAVAGPGFANADLRTTATVATTVNNSIAFAGFAFFYGITFTAGSAVSSASLSLQGASGTAQFGFWFDTCALRLGGNNAAGRMNFGSNGASGDGGKIFLRNTNVQFANASQCIVPRLATLDWNGGSVTLGTAPTTLFTGTDCGAGAFYIRNVDFSNLTSKTLVGVLTSAHRFVFDGRCKLASGLVVAATQTLPGAIVDLFYSDSSTANNRWERYTSAAVETTETNCLLASGPTDGTNPFSRKIVTDTANCSVYLPYESLVISEDWVDTLTGQTPTIELLIDSVTALTDQDVALDIEYIGSGTPPLGSIQTSFGGYLASPAALTSSSVTWSGSVFSGMTNPQKRKITAASFTPGLKGPYRATLRVMKANITLYASRVP